MPNFRKFFARFKKSSPELAMQRAAVLQGEHTVATCMHTFYTEQLKTLDPHNGDHWPFAEIKQKQLDAFDDMGRYARLVDEANAKCNAIKEAKL